MELISTSELKIAFDGLEISYPDFKLSSAEELLIIGPSGVGKSTLIQILSGLQEPTSGEVIIAGENLYQKKLSDRDAHRAKHIGLALQQSHFIDSINVLENLKLALGTASTDHISGTVSSYVLNQMAGLGIKDLAKKKPSALSAGEKQRVNFLRACLGNPSLLLVDEPTANLDDANTELVTKLLKKLSSDHQTALVIVSHDARLKSHFQKQLAL